LLLPTAKEIRDFGLDPRVNLRINLYFLFLLKEIPLQHENS